MQRRIDPLGFNQLPQVGVEVESEDEASEDEKDEMRGQLGDLMWG